MADNSSTSPAAGTGAKIPVPKPVAAPTTTAAPAPPLNPAFKAMGLPNWRPKLPSRNWLIFFTIVSTWTGALIYDRQQKKKAQQKWCTLVSHIKHESLPTNVLPRRVTIYLSAPPGDGLSNCREHFTEYVKPILVAAALDWDVVEGRREGEVRAKTAERIRRLRRSNGEIAFTEAVVDAAVLLERVRERMGVQEWVGGKGDIVIGRNTWKEYVRGLHEGWLGPIDPPPSPPSAVPFITTTDGAPIPAEMSSPTSIEDRTTPPITTDDASPTFTTPEKKKEGPPAEPTKPPVPPPYCTTSSYPSSTLPSSIPTTFPASNPIPFPHILGFFNTPIRIYRFLNRRHLADDVGRQTAAVVLAATREYHHCPSKSNSTSTTSSAAEFDIISIDSSTHNTSYEQSTILSHEEKEWVKHIHKRTDDEPERVWLDKMILDERIATKMRRFELDAEEEERARRIGHGSAGIPGIPGRKVGEVEKERDGGGRDV